MMLRRIALVVFGLMVLVVLASPAGLAKTLLYEWSDPAGDDNGPGTYVYPLNPVFLPGSFDITGFSVIDAGEEVIFEVRIAAPVDNPWGAPNGFSVQMIQVYVDQGPGGNADALPGVNAVFEEGDGWEKVIIAEGGWGNEVEQKLEELVAEDVRAAVHVSHAATAGGNLITIPVSKEWLGEPNAGWRYQLLMLGQEGGPDTMDGIKIRRVLSEPTEWQFGGSDESGYHTNIIDMLVPEGEDQGALLSGHDPESGRYVTIPMLE